MSWNICKHPECESYTARPDGDYCESCRRANAKEEAEVIKQSQKRNTLIAKQKAKNQVPRKTISKNPKDWSNTFLCSDGTRVTQAEINANLKKSYQYWSENAARTVCEGCGGKITCHAHIIPQARLKVIGKTELIYQTASYFDSCFACNLAIENPKGNAWKSLKNIDYCLLFIKANDPELYTKFELSAVNQERETI